MPILVLPAAFGALAFCLRRRLHSAHWGTVLLRTAILFGLVSTLVVEILSAFKAITQIWLFAAWLLAGLLALAGLRNAPPPPGLEGRPEPSLRGLDRVMLAGVVAIGMVTLVVASLTPPQTWDSLNYHMARVAHWAQQASVEHYPTGIEVQNSRPPGAEYLLLQIYVLSQSDRWVNLVQWAAMAIALVGVAGISRILGATRRGQLLAVVYAASLPIGIAEASSTMNDYVVGLWVLAAAAEVVSIAGTRRPSEGPGASVLFAAGAAGLGILTKPTAAAYLIPLGVWLAVAVARKGLVRRAILPGLAGLSMILLLNAPSLLRNVQTYGQTFDPDQVEIHAGLHTPAAWASNVVRSVALHVGTPIPQVNSAVFLAIDAFHRVIGIELNDPRTTAHEPFRIQAPSTHETRSPNPLHAGLVAAIILGGLWRWRRIDRPVRWYGGAVIAGFLLVSTLFQWQIFGSRYHLPIFVAMAPLAGLAVASRPRIVAPIMAAILLIGCIPWLVSIRSRPLLPLPGQASVDSILAQDRQSLYFANGRYLERPYSEMAAVIKNGHCGRVGLMISGSGAEYPFWPLLGAPDQDIELVWLVSGTESAAYVDAGFEPCAVICEQCAESASPYGLGQVYRRSGFALFMADE